MKFSSGVDQLQRENSYLKSVTKTQLVLNIALVAILFTLYDRPPIMVERSSRGLEIVEPTEFTPTEADTKVAISLMMKARFDTDAISPEVFINTKQLVLRDNEQKELKARTMTQSIVVRNVSISKDEAIVDIDRVIAVGEIRSALKTKLKVAFETEEPNELNPYGILLSLADPIEPKPEK